MLSHLSSSESAPPLYYVLAWAWTKLFGTGALGFRSLSALAGTLTIPVVFACGREISHRVGRWAAALATFSPAMYYYSQEARAYALLILFSAIAFLFFAAGPGGSRRAQPRVVGRILGAGAADALLRGLPVRARGADPAGGAWGCAASGRRSERSARWGSRWCRWRSASANSGKANWIEESSLLNRIGETVKQFLVGLYGPGRSLRRRRGLLGLGPFWLVL